MSKFPSVARDLAVVVKANIPAQDLLFALQNARQAILKDVVLFDEFRPTAERSGGMEPDEKSLAFRLTLADDSQTLQDAQVEATVKALIDKMSSQFAARLR
jgi:phenylalanyl-tRNA synthetase beta chain